MKYPPGSIENFLEIGKEGEEMKVNSSHKEYVKEQLEKGRESKYIIKSLVAKGLSKCQAANCVKHVNKRKVDK